jgi:ribonuclease-3
MGLNIDILVNENKEDLTELEQLLGYRFTDLRLLQKALIHASYAFEQAQGGKDNQILEFVGDAVLDLVIGYTLSKRYPSMREGELTRVRAALVNESHLAEMARSVELGRFLCLGKGENASSGRNKSSILSCAFEAVIGAVFEDSGYEVTADLVERLFGSEIENKKKDLLLADGKSRLQEELQDKFNEAPTYSLDREEGPSHKKQFTVSVIFREKILGSGTASSKKEAEQRAAAAALDQLETQSSHP